MFTPYTISYHWQMDAEAKVEASTLQATTECYLKIGDLSIFATNAQASALAKAIIEHLNKSASTEFPQATEPVPTLTVLTGIPPGDVPF